MGNLVQKLSQGDHPVEVSLRPEKSAAALKRRIDEFNYVHVKFTDTLGGTELGVSLDRNESNLADGDFEQGKGQIKLAGRLKLDYVPVKCVAEIDLSTLTGSGHLEIIQESSPADVKAANEV